MAGWLVVARRYRALQILLTCRDLASEHPNRMGHLLLTWRLRGCAYGTNTTRPTTLPALRSASAALASGSLRRVTLIGLSVPF